MKSFTHDVALGFCIIASIIPSFAQLNLPRVATSSFRNLIERNAYVDKTKEMHLMIKDVSERGGWNCIFLTRPRRFGKSLLIDTLNEFYKGERDLFNGTYIFEVRQNYSWTKYPIVRIDFSVLPCNSHPKFQASLTGKLKEIAASNGLNLSSNVLGDIPALTSKLFKMMNEKFGLPVVVLIDEYDIPYSSQLDVNSSEAKNILRTMQNFFAVLKTYTSMIHFCFVTGVTRIPLYSSLTGFNIYLDITLYPEYATIVGFTKKEVINNYKDAIENVTQVQRNTTENILQEMEMWFDGYQFSCKNETVYNPTSVIQYLSSKGWEKKFWAESGRNSYLLRKLEEFPLEALEMVKLYRTGLPNPQFFYPPVLTIRSSECEGFVDLEKKTYQTLLQMLIYTGYITISSCEVEYDGLGIAYSLRFPNREVQTEYQRHISPIVFSDNTQRFTYLGESAKNFLIIPQWEDFIYKLNLFFAKTPSNLFPQNDTNSKEKHYQVLYQSFMIFAGFNWVELDEPADVVVLEDKDAIYITDTKSDGNNTQNQLDQCSKKYLPKYLHSEKKVLCIALVFSGKKVAKWSACVYSNEGKILEQQAQTEVKSTDLPTR